MKKLMTILLVVLAVGSYAQRQKTVKMVDAWAYGSVDTSWVIPISSDYTWSLQVNWTGQTDTLDAVLKVQHSNDGVNYSDYFYTAMIDTMNTAAGSVIFEDDYSSTRYLRLYFEKQHVDAGTLNSWLILRNKINQ